MLKLYNTGTLKCHLITYKSVYLSLPNFIFAIYLSLLYTLRFLQDLSLLNWRKFLSFFSLSINTLEILYRTELVWYTTLICRKLHRFLHVVDWNIEKMSIINQYVHILLIGISFKFTALYLKAVNVLFSTKYETRIWLVKRNFEIVPRPCLKIKWSNNYNWPYLRKQAGRNEKCNMPERSS